MKRKTLLIVAVMASAAVLGFTQFTNAADPVKDPAPPAADVEACPMKGPGERGPGREGFRGPRDQRGGKMFGHRMGGRDGRHEMLGSQLNLTPDQKAKVKEIMEANRPKIEAIRKEEQAKIQAVMDEAQAHIRPVLTPAQQQVMDDGKKLRESMRKLREDAAALKKSE